jgi:rod shape determining protein RodA
MKATPAILNERQPAVDWLLLAAVALLLLMGLAFIYSATLGSETLRSLPFYQQHHFKQAIWCALGAVLGMAACAAPYPRLLRYALVIYWGCMVLLVLVLIPGIGTSHGWGAMRWIDLGPIQIQPSEFAKLGLIMALAHYLSRPVEELRQVRTFWTALGLMALPFVLILREPDLGSALILLPVTLAMLVVAGTPARYLVRLGLAGLLLVSLLLVDVLFAPPNWRLKLEDYQRRRLLVFFGLDYTRFAPPHATPAELQRLRLQQQNDEYCSRQALISVGSGGLAGKGWRQGAQIALGYLPRGVAHNDFIFSVIAEEKGFLGSALVVGLYGVVLGCGLRIAALARDRLGKLLAVGVVVLLFSQVFINIGMNIRILPVTGVPLPLLSYGGSSVLCTLIGLGLLHNVYLHRRD